MTPRYQKYIFGTLLMASVLMVMVLWHMRERAHDRMINGQDSSHTSAPEVAPSEEATLLVANDSDGSMQTQLRSLPLPDDPGARAHAILNKLMDMYAAPDATHPLPGGANAVTQVFLLPAAEMGASALAQASQQPSGPQLAVVNLSASFAANHPSGIETETLTILSVCATLRANLPNVTAVRFLVDGQERATLAGHADLTRTYLTAGVAPANGVQP